MRIIVEGWGRRLFDLELLAPARKPVAAVVPAVPGYDPHSTSAAQVEQASEPPAGFGFGAATVRAEQAR